MKRLSTWTQKVSAFHKKHSRPILITIYLTLGALATWSWQESSERDLECKFDKIDHRIAELEVNLVSHNLHSEQTLLTILKNSTDFDREYIEEMERINAKLIDSSNAFLKGSGKAQNELDEACDEMSRIGWSFLAISLFVGLAVTIISTSPLQKPKTKSVKKSGDSSG